MRQSALPGRQSQLAAAQHLSTSAASAKLLEKKKEYYAVASLERASTLFLERIEGLGEDCEVMADSGEVLGQVLAQWPKMFEILSQFTAQDKHASADGPPSKGQTLVRIPIDELEKTNAS